MAKASRRQRGKYTVFCPRCRWYYHGNDFDVRRTEFLEKMPQCPHCTEVDRVPVSLESHDGWTEYPGPKSKWSQV